MPRLRFARLLMSFVVALSAAAAQAQLRTRAIQDVDLQRLANGVLGIMSYTVAPDVTTSSFSISNAAWSRYAPVFLASDGATQRPVPVKWNSFSATGGIGWDFPIAEHWVVRPIFNFTLGYVTSDLKFVKWWVENNTNLDLSFLDGKTLKAYGLGGALMLDYEKFAPGHDDDLELRYTNVGLKSFGDTASGVVGRAKSESASVWARTRVPTGWGEVWDRPVRYVFEGAYTQYLGDEREVGLTKIASVGFGLELDSSAKDIWVTRWRMVLRYKFGPEVRGRSIGLAVSF